MSTRRRIPAPALLASVVLSASCAREPLSGPPTLRPGRDECAECGMLINEDRFAAGALVDAQGRAEHRVFDDIGCLFDWERDGTHVVLDRFVRDAEGSGWLTAAHARLLVTDPASLRTPMGTGIAAYADEARAQHAQRTHGGRALSFPEAAEARGASMRARVGRTPAPSAPTERPPH